MAEISTWRNGDSGKIVKEIIDTNFTNLNVQIGQLSQKYIYSFSKADWNDGIIFISYSEYLKQNPCIELYVKTSGGYSPVVGGYEINNNGISLQTDLPYDGRVVIR